MSEVLYGMPEAEYFGTDAASNSTIGRMKKTPAHCKQYMEDGMKQTANMRLGSITHKIALEGMGEYEEAYYVAQEMDPSLPRRLTDVYDTLMAGKFDESYMLDAGDKVNKPRGKAMEIAERMIEGDAAAIRQLYVSAPEVNKKTKAGKEAYAEFEAKCEREGLAICKPEDLDKACEYVDWIFTLADRELVSTDDMVIISNYKNFMDYIGDKEVIKQEEFDTAKAMSDSLHAHPIVAKLLAKGKAEASMFWDDPDTGYPCKARIDFESETGFLVDLKTTMDASLSEFSRSIAKFGYHRQDAMYTDGYNSCSATPSRGFIFVAVESSPPYAVGVYTLDAESADKGRMEYKNLLNEFAECKRTNTWPAYSEQVETIELPKWYS